MDDEMRVSAFWCFRPLPRPAYDAEADVQLRSQ
jgi:hypothetical protein